jgi:hypothetical protein
MSEGLHVTDFGIAVYPWLNKPDTQFNADGTYSVGLILDKKSAKKINDVVKPLMNGGKHNPVKKELDDQKQETGNYLVNFKMKAIVRPKNGDAFKQAPVILDEDGNRLTDKLIGGGTKMKVAYVPYAYDGMGGGVTLRLKKVRVAPDGLVEYKAKEDVDWGDDCIDNIKEETKEEASQKDWEADELVDCEEDEDF